MTILLGRRFPESESCCRLSALLDEREQVGIDLVRVGCGHSVRKTGVHLERGILYQFCGLQGGRADGHDLVIVAMKNESGHLELF